jgi:hypothetical protein
MHEPPSYIEGRTDFMVLFLGSHEQVPITQANHREVYLQTRLECLFKLYEKMTANKCH